VTECATKTDFLLPAGFTGPAMILLDDPLGPRKTVRDKEARFLLDVALWWHRLAMVRQQDGS
jgi:hypothetical protein